MTLITDKIRRLEKSSSVTGEKPTLPPSLDHTDGFWGVTDAYDRELFVNLPDGLLFTRDSGDVLELGEPDEIISGLAVTNGSDAVKFDVSGGDFRAKGITRTHTTTADEVTITDGDASDPRFDLIVIDETDTAIAVAGTPSATPVVPTVPARAVVLAVLSVPALHTSVSTPIVPIDRTDFLQLTEGVIFLNEFAGNLDGSGSTNSIPLWADPDTLTDSNITQTVGGNVKITSSEIVAIGDTFSSSTKLTVEGLNDLSTSWTAKFINQSAGELLNVRNDGRVEMLYSNSNLFIDQGTFVASRTLMLLDGGNGNAQFKFRNDTSSGRVALEIGNSWIFTRQGTGGVLISTTNGDMKLNASSGGEVLIGSNAGSSEGRLGLLAQAGTARFGIDKSSFGTLNFGNIQSSFTNAQSTIFKKARTVVIEHEATQSLPVLQLDSVSSGFLAPRMTEAERDAIGTPASGLWVYNSDNNQHNFFNGTSWEIIESSTGGGDLFDVLNTGNLSGNLAPIWNNDTTVTNGALNNSPTVTFRATYDSDPTAGVTPADRDATIQHIIPVGGASPRSRLAFEVDGDEIFAIAKDASGGQAVAIGGGTNPFALLEVDNQLFAKSNIFEAIDSSGNTTFVFTDLGRVGIGTDSPATTLEIKTAITGTFIRYYADRVGGANVGDLQTIDYRFNNSTPIRASFGTVTARVETATAGSEKAGYTMFNALKVTQNTPVGGSSVLVGVNASVLSPVALLDVQHVGATGVVAFRVQGKDALAATLLMKLENNLGNPTLIANAARNVFIRGGSVGGGSPDGVLAMGLGIAVPTSSPIDVTQIYIAEWNGAGTATLHVRNEEDDIFIYKKSAAYTRNATIVEDRTLLASGSATAINNNNVLAALIADLQGNNLIG